MTPVEVLRKAKTIITDPKNWCTGNYRKGEAVCSAGAIKVAEGREPDVEDESQSFIILDAAARKSFGMSAVNVNDKLGHAKTLEMFDRAIALALEQPS